MPNILVSNDDGIFAPGLNALANVLMGLGDVWVVAPKDNQSAVGHKKTLHRPLRAVPISHIFPPEITAYSIDGAPSDCVAISLMGLIDETFDIVVSGINSGPNLGQDVTYSGTVSVALESVIFGVPAIAFSLDSRAPDVDYKAAAKIAQQITRETLKHKLPHQTILNVNIPGVSYEQIAGIQVTQQGLRDYRDVLDKRVDPFGKPYYWIGGVEPTGDTRTEGTDTWAVHNNYVSVTPIHLDLTRHEFISTLQAWNWENNTSTGEEMG